MIAWILLSACKPDPVDTAVDTDPVVDTDVDTDPDTGPDTDVVDGDGDGVPAPDDCDDTDDAVYPGAVEVDDLVDQDCDGLADEDFVAAGDVFFTEVMARGTASEWVELHNGSSRTVALAGWTIDVDGVAVTLGAGVLAPGAYGVVGPNGDPSTNGGVSVDVVAALPALGDAAGTLTLTAAAPIATLGYGAGSDLADGASIGLDPTRYAPADRGLEGSWCAGTVAFGPGGDGSPGAVHERCGRIDHDGDGRSADAGDCDDDDPRVSPGAAEDFDGADNDCDGKVDVVKVSAVAAGFLGAGTGEDLGWRGLSRGDLDDDGELDLVLGAPALGGTKDSQIHVVPAAGYASFAGPASGAATTTITTARNFGYLGPRQGDTDGDGDHDLVAIGWYRGDALRWFEGPLPSGALDEDDATLVVTDAASPTEGAVLSDVDADGDGACGFIVGAPDGPDGRVLVWTGDPGSGSVTWADADATWSGKRERLGRALGAGDFDGDGADDVAVSDYANGTVYIVPAAKVDDRGNIADLAAWTFDVASGTGAYGGLTFGDLDLDGTEDFVLGEPFAPARSGLIDGGRVEVWYGGLAKGSYLYSSADILIEGDGMGTIYDFGHEVGVADDPFGTGPRLLVSSPVTGSPSSWLFAFDATTATSWRDAVATLNTAPGASDQLGHRFFDEDLDEDGDIEWVIAAPATSSATDPGRIWFLEGP